LANLSSNSVSSVWIASSVSIASALTAPAAASSAVSTTAATVFFGTGFVDVDRPSVKLSAVQFGNRPICFGGIGHFDESETSGLAGIAVGHNAYALNRAIRFKQRSNRVFGCSKAEVPYKNILHLLSFKSFSES
jgi:hypothetical protein